MSPVNWAQQSRAGIWIKISNIPECLIHWTKANKNAYYCLFGKTFLQSWLLLSAKTSHPGLVITYDCKTNKHLSKHLCKALYYCFGMKKSTEILIVFVRKKKKHELHKELETFSVKFWGFSSCPVQLWESCWWKAKPTPLAACTRPASSNTAGSCHPAASRAAPWPGHLSWDLPYKPLSDLVLFLISIS